MRVGIFLEELSANSGGAFTFENAIVQGLAHHSSGHEYYLLHRGHRGTGADAAAGLRYVQVDGIKFAAGARRHLRTAVFERAGGMWRRAFRQRSPVSLMSPLNRALIDHQIDLLWFPTHYHEPVEIPFVSTIWDLQHRLQPYFPEVSVAGALWEDRERHFTTYIPRATFVIVGNETAKAEVMRFYGVAPERIRCIDFPTPEFALRPAGTPVDVHRRFNIETPKYLFYPAQFWPHKNHVTVLKAVRLLADAGRRDFTLALTGTDKGNLAHVQATAERLGVSDRVRYLGFVTQEELTALYRGAVALTFASFFGPNNFPPLEAMGLGCPVLCADAAGMREQLGDAALYFAPSDAAALSELIQKVDDDSKVRSDLIAGGHARAARFGGDDYVREVVRLFDEFQPIRDTWGPTGSYQHS